MNKILLCFLLVAFGCTSTKQQLRESFAKAFILDTGYFKVSAVLEFHGQLLPWEKCLVDSLIDKGALRFVKYGQNPGGSWSVHEVTDSGKKYLVKIYYPQRYDSTNREAVFNYYRLESIKLTGYSFLNKPRDSVRATIKSTYSITPIFPADETTKIVYPIFKKAGEDWELADPETALFEIYIRHSKGCYMDLSAPEKYFNWSDSMGRYNDSIARHSRDSLYQLHRNSKP